MTKNPFTKVKRVHRDRYDVYCDGEYSWTFIERVSGKWFVSHEECGRGSEAFTRFIDAKRVATAVVEVEADKMAEAEYQRSMSVGPEDLDLPRIGVPLTRSRSVVRPRQSSCSSFVPISSRGRRLSTSSPDSATRSESSSSDQDR